MRNSDYLDTKMPEDSKIGFLQTDEDGRQCRMVDGKKIYQIEEKTQHDKDMNTIINRVRASGMTPSQYLKSMYGSF